MIVVCQLRIWLFIVRFSPQFYRFFIEFDRLTELFFEFVVDSDAVVDVGSAEAVQALPTLLLLQHLQNS